MGDKTSDPTDFPTAKFWDHSPIKLPAYYHDIVEFVSARKAAYRSLVKTHSARASGSKPYVLTISTAHTVAIRDKLFADFTFEDLPPEDFESFVRQAISRANAAHLVATSGDPDALSKPKPSGYHFPYPNQAGDGPAATTLDFNALNISAADALVFKTDPQAIDDLLYEYCQTIIKTFASEAKGITVKSECSDNGLAVLRYLHGRVQKVRARTGAALTREWEQHMSRGIEGATIDAWNTFYGKAFTLQRAMPKPRRPEHHERTKHIERRHFFIREKVESGVLHVPFVKTDDNLADFFTKPLAPGKFEALRDAIMNVPYGRAAEIRRRRSRGSADGGVLEGVSHVACHETAPPGCHWTT